MAQDLTARFQQAQKDVETLKSRPRNDDLLTVYAFYKQGTVGDVQGKRPGFTDIKGRAKYDAWAKLKGTTQDSAMQGYIDKVEALLAADK